MQFVRFRSRQRLSQNLRQIMVTNVSGRHLFQESFKFFDKRVLTLSDFILCFTSVSILLTRSEGICT